MKTLKRLFAILLALTFVGTVLVGCTKTPADTSDKGENSGDPTGDTQRATNEYGEESFSSVVPQKELDFEGEELTVLVRDLKKCSREWFKEVNVLKYIAYYVEAVNINKSVSLMLDPTVKMHNLCDKYGIKYVK